MKPDIEQIMIGECPYYRITSRGGYVTDFNFKSGNMKDFSAWQSIEIPASIWTREKIYETYKALSYMQYLECLKEKDKSLKDE